MKQTKFTLPQEALGEATQALLLGDFNNWDINKAISLSLDKDGSLAAELSLAPGVYEYRYFLNDGRWVNDAAAERFAYNAVFNVENSVIVVSHTEEVIKAAKPKTVKKAEATKTTKTAAKKAEAPKAKVVANAADDLTKIEGIGSKIAKLLAEEQIVSFKDLAKATNKKLKTILEAAGSKFAMHNPASWPKQAKLAAAGKWEELKTLQEELKGGK